MHNSNIKDLYNKTSNKKELTVIVADHFNMNPRSIQCNWFSGFYSVPAKHQDKLISIMQNFVNKESKTLTT